MRTAQHATPLPRAAASRTSALLCSAAEPPGERAPTAALVHNTAPLPTAARCPCHNQTRAVCAHVSSRGRQLAHPSASSWAASWCARSLARHRHSDTSARAALVYARVQWRAHAARRMEATSLTATTCRAPSVAQRGFMRNHAIALRGALPPARRSRAAAQHTTALAADQLTTARAARVSLPWVSPRRLVYSCTARPSHDRQVCCATAAMASWWRCAGVHALP